MFSKAQRAVVDVFSLFCSDFGAKNPCDWIFADASFYTISVSFLPPYFRFHDVETEKYEEKKEQKAAWPKENCLKSKQRGGYALKRILLKEGDSPIKIRGFEKAWFSGGLSPSYISGAKIAIFQHPPIIHILTD